MKPWTTLDTEQAPDGRRLVLQQRDGVYVIRIDGHELMSSLRHGSEEAMARVGLEGCRAPAPKVLVGGLGLGYTLRAALDRISAAGSVAVVEFSAAVVKWNQGPLAHLAGRPLDDPRVKVERCDVGKFAAKTKLRFDAILLDVDNGPAELTREGNHHLYGQGGLSAFRQALRPGGFLVIWSAGPAPRFPEEFKRAGFLAREEQVAVRPGAKAKHVLFVGQRPYR